MVKAFTFFFEQDADFLGFDGGDAGAEDDAFSFFDGHFKITRGEEVFSGFIAALAFFGVFQSSIPVGAVVPSRFFAGLHVEVGISLIETHSNAVAHLVVAAVGCSVFVSPLSNASESEEGSQTQGGGGVCIQQGVANVDAMNGSVEKDFFFEEYAAHAVGPSGNLLPFKADDVFVSLGTVVLSLIFMQPEVKFGSVLNDRLVKR